MWVQLLIMTPPSAIIAGHSGHSYLKNLNYYLSGEFGDTDTEALQFEAKRINSLTAFMSHYQHIGDVSGFVNILVLCFMIYRELFARG